MVIMNRLRARWGVESGWQVLAILTVFSCTGMSVVLMKDPLFRLVGFDEFTPTWVRAGIYILTIFPLYQILLLVFAGLFGQFSFFWEFEKRSMSRLRGLWGRFR